MMRAAGKFILPIAFIVFLAIFTEYDFTGLSRLFAASSNRQLRNITGSSTSLPTGRWAFDFQRDGNNHGLTEEQCDTSFPLLNHEIDRAVEYRRQEGNLTEDDLEIAWCEHGIVRVLIRDNQLYVVDTLKVERGHRTRYLATLNSINKAISAHAGKLPNVEFTFCVQDNCMANGRTDRVTLSYSRRANHENLWLMPDFGFWGWPKVGMPSYHELRTVLDDSEPPFREKIPKLIWRGHVPGHPTRQNLVKQSQGRPWSAVQSLEWKDGDDVEGSWLSMEDHCDYMFTAMTEGNTWSGRFKLLLNCHSTIVSHQLRWIEHFHHLLVGSGKSQNFIVLDRKFDGLPETMEGLLEPSDDLREAGRIADNARRIFREQYLTPAAISCYWRALIRGWASVQGFEPKLWTAESSDNVSVTDGRMSNRRKTRGVPFESYIIMEALEWELPAQPRMLVLNNKLYYSLGGGAHRGE